MHRKCTLAHHLTTYTKEDNTMYELTPSTTFEPSIMQRWEQYRLGWDYATAKEPYTHCRNAEQRRGYLDACKSEAVATLPANSADRLGF